MNSCLKNEFVLDCILIRMFSWFSQDVKRRTDLRHIAVASVDPPGCTDIDDALHCRELGNGNWEVGVHIADVSHFIRPGTAIDKEAAKRGTTVYLIDRVSREASKLTFNSFWPMTLLIWVNPLRAKFFRGNINIYLHFMSLLHIDMTEVLKILPQVRPGPTYST